MGSDGVKEKGFEWQFLRKCLEIKETIIMKLKGG